MQGSRRRSLTALLRSWLSSSARRCRGGRVMTGRGHLFEGCHCGAMLMVNDGATQGTMNDKSSIVLGQSQNSAGNGTQAAGSRSLGNTARRASEGALPLACITRRLRIPCAARLAARQQCTALSMALVCHVYQRRCNRCWPWLFKVGAETRMILSHHPSNSAFPSQSALPRTRSHLDPGSGWRTRCCRSEAARHFGSRCPQACLQLSL